MIDSRVFGILLVDSDQGKSAAVVTPPPSTQCVDGSSLPAACAVRRASNAAFRPSTPRVWCTMRLHACPPLIHCMPHHLCRGGTALGPGTRANTCAPPFALLTMAPLTSGPDRRLPGLYRTIVGSSSTFSLRASQRHQPRAVRRSSWPPGFESRVPIHVRPSLLTSTLCPDHGTSERSCTHPACAACSPSTSASHPHRLSPDGPASAP